MIAWRSGESGRSSRDRDGQVEDFENGKPFTGFFGAFFRSNSNMARALPIAFKALREALLWLTQASV
ncbi:MAG: hypothetical protein J2P13_13220, partial [Acidobacteria bacterium]|nr:hypothetical protein [Acidobacteriota bacterium]